MKKKILFVDDEENILQGLERSLHSMLDLWDMRFCLGGENGLKAVTTESFDAVVSDMTMPGMGGVEFLSKVRDLTPSAARFALSGNSEKEMLIESSGICHQYLLKPCNPKDLKDVICRAVNLQNTIHSDELKKIVSQIKQLPSAPVLYNKIREELMRPEPEGERISNIISQDVAMTAKVLHLVNTAFFGLPRQVSSAEDATKLLGFDLIEKLVLAIEIFAAFDESEMGHLNINKLWDHSFATGQLAKEIAMAERSEKTTIDQSMISGILHDIGKLVIAANYPDCYIDGPANHSDDDSQKELKHLHGDSHAEVGAYLMGLWGLPNPIIEAVAFHHQPDRLECYDFTPLTAVHAANALLYEFNSEGKEIQENRNLNVVHLSNIGLDSRIPVWRMILSDSAQGNQDTSRN